MINGTTIPIFGLELRQVSGCHGPHDLVGVPVLDCNVERGHAFIVNLLGGVWVVAKVVDD